MHDNGILRLPAVSQETGRGRSSIYNDVADELLTAPVRVGRNAVGWPAGEIRAINRAKIAGKGEDEIRALVRQLHAARRADGAGSNGGSAK